MVVNIGALKARDYAVVYDDIREVVNAVDVPVKVILETVLLSDEEKIAASYLAAEAGAQFVKTCTGFAGGEATAADVALMKRTVRYRVDVKVKASGGIRTAERCIALLRAGAERIGTFVLHFCIPIVVLMRVSDHPELPSWKGSECTRLI